MEESLFKEEVDRPSSCHLHNAVVLTPIPTHYLAVLNLDEGESIISLLECPVCQEIMKPPIIQCQNGHNVCEKCRSVVGNCSVCEATFIDTKNLLAETLANKVRYPCSNFGAGCLEKIRLQDMASHETSCPYRYYHCLPGETENCTWKGRRWEIQQHVVSDHYKSFFEGDFGNFTTSVSDWEAENEFTFLFSSCGELFWYRSKFDPETRRLYRVLQYIGLKDNASNYRYEHQLFSKDQEMSIANVARNDSETLDSIFKSLHCFVVDFDILKNYLFENTKLRHRIIISKSKFRLS